MDSNELQTALARAVANEEYAFAARIRDLMKMLDEGSTSNPANWYKLGLPDWLSERAEQLGYKLPTEVQRRAAPVIVSGSDAVIKSGTGAFFLPFSYSSGPSSALILCSLAQLCINLHALPQDVDKYHCALRTNKLFTDYMGNFKFSLETSPILHPSHIIASTPGSGKTLAFLLPALAQLDYTVPRDDLLAPQLLILVPTRELGVQIALLVWRLFGGNISSRLPGDSANMFHFNGPRLLKGKQALVVYDIICAN